MYHSVIGLKYKLKIFIDITFSFEKKDNDPHKNIRRYLPL